MTRMGGAEGRNGALGAAEVDARDVGGEDSPVTRMLRGLGGSLASGAPDPGARA